MPPPQAYCYRGSLWRILIGGCVAQDPDLHPWLPRRHRSLGMADDHRELVNALAECFAQDAQ